MDRTDGRRTYEFGPFRLDLLEHLLLRDGQPVALTPKAFDLLAYFVEHPNTLLDKDTLLAALWPATVVEEANLAFQVSTLRKVLDESRPGPSLIQTVPTKGYRFVAPVTSLRQSHGETRSRRATSWWSIAGGCIVVVGVLIGAWSVTHTSMRIGTPAAAVATAPTLVRLTYRPGIASQPTFSPDGDAIAFDWQQSVDSSRKLFVVVVGHPEVRQLTDGDGEDIASAWSPDGRQVAFVRWLRPSNGHVYVVSFNGGPVRKVSNLDVRGRVSWSADSSTVLVGGQETGKAQGIYGLSVEDGQSRLLLAGPAKGRAFQPSVSPSGRQLAYVSCRRDSDYGVLGCEVDVADIDAQAHAVSSHRRLGTIPWVGTLTWVRDERSIMFAGDADDGRSGTFRLSLDGNGRLDVVDAVGPGVCSSTMARSRDRLAFTRSNIDVDVFAARAGAGASAVLSSSADDTQPTYSNDGKRIAYVSNRSGTPEVWVAMADGSGAHQLTHGPRHKQWSPRWSPDDRHIAFQSQEQDGDWHIWVIDAEGGAPTQLTFGRGEQTGATWSRDGHWIYFSDGYSPSLNIWRIPSSGGRASQVTTHGSGFVGYETNDGTAVVYQQRPASVALVMQSLTGGEERVVVTCAEGAAFTVNAQGIYYLPCGGPYERDPVHLFDPSTGKDRIVAVLDHLDIYDETDLAVSPDGSTFLYVRFVNEERGADLWMLENFR